MIHRVIFGSIERFFGILVEHFAGKFPLWLTPVQVALLPINDDLVPYAESVNQTLINAGLRTEADSRTESLNKKVRDAQLKNIPLILTIGNKEMESGNLSVRTLDGKVRFGVSQEIFMERVQDHIQHRKLDLKVFSD
jgi:threonyl-tRNA synthetase